MLGRVYPFQKKHSIEGYSSLHEERKNLLSAFVNFEMGGKKEKKGRRRVESVCTEKTAHTSVTSLFSTTFHSFSLLSV